MDARVPTKVYIRGLDVMNPTDVKAYVAQHCLQDSIELERLEWIDDNSANLLFASESIAFQALAALAADPLPDLSHLPARHLISAKPFSERPDIFLQVRPSLESDKKQVGAALRSRFYLLNPEYDPEERRKRNEARRYRDRRDDRGSDGFSRRGGRQSRDDDEPFDVNLYDDASTAHPPPPPARERTRHRQSLTPDYEVNEPKVDSHRLSNRGRELFPDDAGSRRGSTRTRSVSPMRHRNRDSIRNMDGDVDKESATAREQNRNRAQVIKRHISSQNRARELFPTEPSTESGRLDDRVEDAAILLAKGITLPLMDNSSDIPPVPSRKLEDRITVPGKGRLADRITVPDSAGSSALSIRGAASQRSSGAGFAIKGSAGKSAKELFPDKFGSNAGKELFGDRSGQKSRQRRKAGDLFD